MFHWDVIVLYSATVLGACVLLVLAICQSRWRAVKLILPALLLGTLCEVGVFSLYLLDIHSAGWWIWLFFHQPASLALDPLDLPFKTWAWVTIGLNSLIAIALWYYGLKWIEARWKARGH